MRQRLLRLPKAELHVHLDGSIRPSTLLELADERGVPLPADTPEGLRTWMTTGGSTTGAAGRSLESYLRRFDVTLAVLQDADALERVAYELVLDHAAENVRWVEVRFCPLLNTENGMTPEGAVDAALRGLRRAEQDADVRAAVIVCALRTLEPVTSVEVAELAVAYRGRGVCGFDIAGAEAGYPVKDHADAFERAARAGVPITVHAGEAYGPDSIQQALDVGHARRIGHGTRLHEDRSLLATVRRRGVPLEVCLTSNVQTGVVASISAHPARRYHHESVAVSLATDNRLVSGVTLTDEYVRAHDDLGFTWPELVAVARAGFEHAFAGAALREDLLRRFDEDVEVGI